MYVNPTTVKVRKDLWITSSPLQQAKVSGKEFNDEFIAGITSALHDIHCDALGLGLIVL